MSTLRRRIRRADQAVAGASPDTGAALERLATEVEVVDSPDSGLERERFGFESLVEQMNYLGTSYPLGLLNQTYSGDSEGPDASYQQASHLFSSVGPIFAVMIQRMVLFSQVQMLWQERTNGIPGNMFGHRSLGLIERPQPRMTTADLMARAELDVSLAGNWFGRRHRQRIWRLRPDWVYIVIGSQSDPDADDPSLAIDAEVVGYWYRPTKDQRGTPLLPEEVAHWAPIPDPDAHYRGISWVEPIMRQALGYSQAVDHKRQFFERGATPNLVVLPSAEVGIDEFRDFIDYFRDEHEGALNAYKTLFLGGGSTVQSVGISMKDMDYSKIQGIDETMIAAAGNCPPVVAGFSEGLAAATYSNYGQARRKFADMYARPQWGSFAGAVEPILDRPSRGRPRLWYFDRDVPALREDAKELAAIRQTDMGTVAAAIGAGFKADAAVQYANSGDLAVLEGQHTGLTSVQLQAPADESTDPPDDAADTDDDEPEGD